MLISSSTSIMIVAEAILFMWFFVVILILILSYHGFSRENGEETSNIVILSIMLTCTGICTLLYVICSYVLFKKIEMWQHILL